MEQREKVIKESLNFSKLENVVYRKPKVIFVKEGYMTKVSKIVLILSLVIVIGTVGVFLLYDKIGKIGKTTVSQQTQKEEILVKEPEPINAIVSMVIGDVKVQNIMKVQDLEVGYTLKQGDIIITSKDSECEIQVNKKAMVRVGEKTKVSFSEIALSTQDKKESVIELVGGNVKAAVKGLGKDEFKIKTSTAVAAVRGTRFSVSSDEAGKTKVVVSEGKVAVSVRSKIIEDLAKSSRNTEVAKLETVGEVFVEQGKEITVKPEDQKKVDEKIEKAVSKERVSKLEGDVILNEISKIVSDVSKEVKLEKKTADKNILASLDKVISKDLVVEAATVKIKFIPGEGVGESKLFLNGVEISKLPVDRILDPTKEYEVKVESKGKVIFFEKMKFDKDGEVIIKKVEEETKVIETEQQVPSENKVLMTIDSGSEVSVGYGKWSSYGKNYIFATPDGIGIFDGNSIRKIKVKGISYGFSGNLMVSISKDENDFIVVNVANVNGKMLSSLNLGETTKGTVVVSRPAILENRVFVPSIIGVFIIDVEKSQKKLVKEVGSIYSDIVPMDDKVVCVNEIGEVYYIYPNGSYSKIAQLSTTTLRKASITSDSENIYIYSKGTLYIVGKGKELKVVNTGIKGDSLPIVYKNKLVLFGDKKILVLNTLGETIYTINLVGSIQGMPYVGDGYIVVSATDGVHLYNIDTGKEIDSYDVLGNSVAIMDGKIYVIGNDKTTVLKIK